MTLMFVDCYLRNWMSRESFYCRALHSSRRLLGCTRRPNVKYYIKRHQFQNIFFGTIHSYINMYVFLGKGGDTMVVETRCSVHYKHLIIIRNEKDFSIFLVPRFHRLFWVRSSKYQNVFQLNVIIHQKMSL